MTACQPLLIPNNICSLNTLVISCGTGGSVWEVELDNFQCLSILLIWTTVEQGPTVYAVGTGGDCLDIFSLAYQGPVVQN